MDFFISKYVNGYKNCNVFMLTFNQYEFNVITYCVYVKILMSFLHLNECKKVIILLNVLLFENIFPYLDWEWLFSYVFLKINTLWFYSVLLKSTLKLQQWPIVFEQLLFFAFVCLQFDTKSWQNEKVKSVGTFSMSVTNYMITPSYTSSDVYVPHIQVLLE